MSKKLREKCYFGVIFVLLCIWGGFYDFSIAVYGIVFLAGIGYSIWKNGSLRVLKHIVSVCLLLYLAGSVLSIIPAADRGMAFTGAFRVFTLCLFWLFWTNAEGGVRRRIIRSVPTVGCVITVIAFFLYFIPQCREYLYRAGRLGGSFQYSNTYALFLLICLLEVFLQENAEFVSSIKKCILMLGIIFCGSRSIMLLAIAAFGVLFMKSYVGRKQLAWVGAAVVTAFLAANIFFSLDVNRLWKLSLASSTLNGRFLYWKDALPVIAKNPMGLGYMGYYFWQPRFQTGNYVTRFVHNDILQIALDAGILAAAAIFVMFLTAILNKQRDKKSRVILGVIFLHCLFDFDLQYMAVFCIALMYLYEEKPCIEWKGKKLLPVAVVLTSIYIYFFIAFGLQYAGDNDAALRMFPWNTTAREELLTQKRDEKNARWLVKHNRLNGNAYECLADLAIEEGNYEESYVQIRNSLDCAGYDIEKYNNAIYRLSIALDQALKCDDKKMVQRMLEEIQMIPERLEALKKKTSSLAYRINDIPEFTLDKEIQDYIESLKGISFI